MYKRQLIDRAHVLVQGLAHAAGLLGPVQHRQASAGGGDGGQEVLRGEGAVQVDVDEAHLLPPGGEVVHSLPGGLGGGAHEDHHPLRVRRAVVVEEMLFRSYYGLWRISYFSATWQSR